MKQAMKQTIFRTLILALCLSTSWSVFAQGGRHSSTKEEKTEMIQGIGWIHTHFLTNWYLQAQIGPQLYYGYEDRKGPLFDRITTDWEFHAGRWIFPMLGVRLGVGHANYIGFQTLDTYNSYDHAPEGYGNCGYWDASHVEVPYGTPGATAMHGYYHTFDKNSSLLQQRWEGYYISPDLMFNMSFLNFYNPKKTYTTHLYLGVTFLLDFNTNPQVNWNVDPNMAANVHFGLIENLTLTKRLKLFADIRFSMYEGRFDREITPYEKGIFEEDFAFNANIGLSYNINFIGKKKQAEWLSKHFNKEIDPDNMPDQIYTYHRVDINKLSYTDTLFINDTISEFSEEYEQMLKKKADEIGKKTIDSLLISFNDKSDNYNLYDILQGKLVPFEMVFFEIDKWDIMNSENLKIAKMAYIMKNNPDRKFLLFGSADSKTGTVQRNEFLSVNRADVVYNKLVYEYNINPEQLQRIYLGGILDYKPFELNRATVIIMDHPKVMQEFLKLRDRGEAGGQDVDISE